MPSGVADHTCILLRPPAPDSVCGSDVHFWKHAGLGPWTITDKTALGHESGGIVIAVGEGVDNVKVGDKVAIEPGVPCGKVGVPSAKVQIQ